MPTGFASWFPLALQLSCWVERVRGIHDRAEISQACGEIRQGRETPPGQQETGTDEGLPEKPESGEPVFLAGTVHPGVERIATILMEGF